MIHASHKGQLRSALQSLPCAPVVGQKGRNYSGHRVTQRESRCRCGTSSCSNNHTVTVLVAQVNNGLKLMVEWLLGSSHARRRGGLSWSNGRISGWRVPSSASVISCDWHPSTSRAGPGAGFHASYDGRISTGHRDTCCHGAHTTRPVCARVPVQ